jgi:hypothetical protein
LIAVSFSASCGTAPKYIPPDGQGAYLQNKLVEIEGARFFHFFEYANDVKLEPAGINKAAHTSRVIFKTNSPYDKSYKISPGPTVVGVRVVYTPSFGRNLIAQMNDVYFHVFVRDMHIADEHIAYLTDNIPGAEPGDLDGMRGLRFDALADHTYTANSRIRDGRATVWIEDEDGAAVSAEVLAFGEGNVEIHGTFGELYEANPFTDGLPDPSYGWGIQTSLPDPPHVRRELQTAVPTDNVEKKYSRIYDELIRLGDLRDQGAITQEEFEQRKKALLSEE